jgi:Flp pilus assembly pilin Flp
MAIYPAIRNLIGKIKKRVFWADERGSTAVEYGMIASLIAAAVIAGVFFLGQSTNGSLECTKNSIIASTNQC